MKVLTDIENCEACGEKIDPIVIYTAHNMVVCYKCFAIDLEYNGIIRKMAITGNVKNEV